jgi:rhamnose utilization protein RhaD (predicted bifunctional aldolase and dehydrogenase)/NAD(P)-dependent dehydrogenase (short-subunit alcohol dehydrogenase family)
MQSRWSDSEAQHFIDKYTSAGCPDELSLRVYTSRLLGQEPRLVLHGGGNTSVKTKIPDVLGKDTDVLCVKGSGWDLGNIEPAGLPAVRLEKIRDLASLNFLSDEDMVNAQRINLLDASAPNPSVETLLHAFLPHKFVDHTHANAVLALTDQEGGTDLCREVFGDRMGYVPYIMPGFDLAKKAKEVFEKDPNVDGLILLKHGIFTFGETAQKAYELMIEMTTLAEETLARRGSRTISIGKIQKTDLKASQIAPILRGLCSINAHKPMLMDFRTNDLILRYLSGDDLNRYSQLGTVTPDHVIRTKPKPLIIHPPAVGNLTAFSVAAKEALKNYREDYQAYFARHNKNQKTPKTELDSLPRVILIPGLGLFGLGESRGASKIAADLAETNIEVISHVEAMGRFEAINEADIFDIEYWSLEQAKLGKAPEKPLARKIVAITGGGSGIGAATAEKFAKEGATVAVLDLDSRSAKSLGERLGGLGIGCDVTNAHALNEAFDCIAETFGGLDILVSNAGAAWQGRIGEVEEELLRKSFELNFFAHQAAAQAAVRIFKAQGIGGCILFNTSKQAVNPGKDFGPYGLPKAATLFLMKQYALDHGRDGIRSSAVNADRIRSGLLTSKMISDRSKARGLTETEYMSGNLLGREVTAEDVAKAFFDLATAEKTTGAILTVDGGNIEASLR